MTDIKNLVQELRAYENEMEWLEFKENWFEPSQLGEYVSAISNSAAMEGRACGYFVWGVHDKTHEITGTSFNPDRDVKNEPLKHFLARQLSPDLNFSFSEVDFDGKKVVVLAVPAAKNVPTSFANERYIRIGSSKESLRKYPEKEAFLFDVLRHGFPTTENTPSDYQDLSFEKLFIYYGAKGLSLKKSTFKKNLGLLTADGRYNVLAQILSDNSHIPIRVAIFSGTTKSSKLFSVREFGFQCLLYSLDEILRYGDVLNILQTDESNRIVERKEVPLFENDAFREAVINAFVHNKWVSENEPMITVYSDRIEILSRGALPPEQTLEGFFAGESVPVNKRLSEIFLQLHISERTGRGVPKITEKYGRNAYEFRENSIVVRIPFNWLKNSEVEKSDIPTKPEQFLNETQKKVLSEIQKNPKVTKEGLSKLVKRGKTAVDTAISILKKLGFIERRGSRKSGFWQVVKQLPVYGN
nr:putative DNA binding domain-containing protein [Treponema sp.]